MMSKSNENLIFQDNNGSNEAVLGVLEGPCADFMCKTRNGRKYPESLWQKVFDDPIVNEMIEAGGIPGELDHPEDREDVDSSRIAILLKEKPKKKDGKLWAKFSILNTPLGKIAYTLAKAGFKLGISSRGSGDVIQDYNGEETVDESTYNFKCFDLVLLPAVKDARLNLVTESFDTNKVSYKKLLKESLDNASEKDRKLMEDTLKSMKIDYSEEDETQGYSPDGVNNIADKAVEVEDDEKAIDDGDLLKQLQEALTDKQRLENEVLKLQEKLSVSYAKEATLEEDCERYKKSIITLSDKAKEAKTLKNLVENLNSQISKKNEEIKGLSSVQERSRVKNTSLQESLNSKSDEIVRLKKENKLLQEKYALLDSKTDDKINSLNEEVESLKKDSELKHSEYFDKLSKSNELVEKYRRIAKNAVDKYIQLNAQMIGVSPIEIKNKLSENYTFSDIDTICEDLKSYKINVSKLPFGVTKDIKNAGIKVDKPASISRNNNDVTDVVDKQLLQLAGLD